MLSVQNRGKPESGRGSKRIESDSGVQKSYREAILNGFYESERIRYGEANFGSPEFSQSLLNLLNMKETKVYLEVGISSKSDNVEEIHGRIQKECPIAAVECAFWEDEYVGIEEAAKAQCIYEYALLLLAKEKGLAYKTYLLEQYIRQKMEIVTVHTRFVCNSVQRDTYMECLLKHCCKI